MEKIVVIDASLAVMWAVPENYSGQALMLAEAWGKEEIRLLAPCLLLTEVTNALYKRIIRKEMNLPKVQEAMEVILAFGIEIHEEAGLHTLALDLSLQLGQTATYDAHYLALAVMHGCPLWTGDRRFYNSARKSFPQVHWVGEGG
ncbi:MAG: type II toxin-antitoxin system VapC family toxin [Pseudomonadota bacterium]